MDLFDGPTDKLINLYSASGFRPVRCIVYISHYYCGAVLGHTCGRCNQVPDKLSLRPYVMCDICECRPSQLNCDTMYYKATGGEIMICKQCIVIVDKKYDQIISLLPAISRLKSIHIDIIPQIARLLFDVIFDS